MRGEELYNTELTLNQFGIVALTGGMLNSKHFDAIRLSVGRNLKQENVAMCEGFLINAIKLLTTPN